MSLVLPITVSPVRITLEHPLTDDELQRLCEQNEVFHVEREPDGSLLARKCGSGLSGLIGANLCGELGNWAEKDGRGRAYSYAGYRLGDGSMRGPALSWMSHKRSALLTAKQREGFPPLAPEFVIEQLTWSWTLPELQEKMRAWIANGVDVAWLVDPKREVVEVYRHGREVKVVADRVVGEGPVDGFVLELGKIWR